MNELVARLSNGLHEIVAERSATALELREQIERGFVLLKFPNTRGGTELGSQLDREQTRLDGANFESATGSVHLVGSLTLNYVKVQLVADIDLATLKGTGQLVLVEAAAVAQQARAGVSAAAKDQLSQDEGAGSDAVAEAKVEVIPKKKKTNGARAA